MAICYVAILIFSMSISWFVYYNLNYRFTIQKSADLSMQTLYSLKSNIYNMVSNVEYNSRIILSNTEIQDVIKNGRDLDEFVSQQRVSTSLVLLMNSMPSIDSLYVFDNYGHCYGTGRQPPHNLKIKNVQSADWYNQVFNLQGACLLRMHANSIFYNADKDDTISLLRVINDTVSQKPIGILMMNISNTAFQNCYSEMVKRYGSVIVLLSDTDQCIVNDSALGNDQIKTILQKKSSDASKPVILNSQGKRYIYSVMPLDNYNWKIVMGIPMEEIDQELSLYQTISFIVILLNIFLLWGGTIIISRMITNPIHKLLESMKSVELGKFSIVQMHTGKDEIGQLKDGYNLMITEIQQLLKKTVSDQKAKRKLELNVLYEQIKPHFLYNTLDAMGYLALAGKSGELYDALEALGGYYRKSLSKGDEVISVADEIEIAHDYILLQKLRFGNIFTSHIEADPRTYQYKTLKLILQPLIENSIYHGIQPKGEPCDIWIRAQLSGSYLLLTVEDNGVGMTKEELERITVQKIDRNTASFGLRGTIERLQLYYEHDDIYAIESEKNKGTKITLFIPVEEKERGLEENAGTEPTNQGNAGGR
jgi:two-component system sensor histidine kinase YesM